MNAQQKRSPLLIQLKLGIRMSKPKNKLSAIEMRDRIRLEKIARDRIAEGLRDLDAIEQMGTWRETHKTFDAYCLDRLGFSRSQLNIETLFKRFTSEN